MAKFINDIMSPLAVAGRCTSRDLPKALEIHFLSRFRVACRISLRIKCTGIAMALAPSGGSGPLNEQQKAALLKQVEFYARILRRGMS